MADLAAGDDLALNRIMNRWKDRLAAFLYRMVGDSHQGLDLAQETFVRVYRHRGSYQPHRNFSTWIFGIAANLARNHLRWKRRHPEELLETTDDSSHPVAPNATPHEQAATREKVRAVQQAINDLPSPLREALVLSIYEGLPHEEIAHVTDSTAKAVEIRIHRARNLLRQRMANLLAQD